MIPLLLLHYILAIAHSNPCPDGYKQLPSGGDCFKSKTFFDNFAGQYTPKSFAEADGECNADKGGLLASIHSQEENDFVRAHLPCDRWWLNIGLRCTGIACRWNDGSPLTFANFQDDGPTDDGIDRCYGMSGDAQNGKWLERGCGKEDADCWVCRVKARTIDCAEGETEYKGGCVSVHSTPKDQRSAEDACPGDGHLVSVHSNTENKFYAGVAIDAGVTGTIFIGGKFTKGVFEWTDITFDNTHDWAKPFPNTIFGQCVQMLLNSELGEPAQWSNIDCAVEQPYMCFRDGADYGPTLPLPIVKANAQCPPIQYFTGTGTIYSPNYPLSIPSNQSCEYIIGTDEGTVASIKFNTYDCQSGSSISLFDGLNSVTPFLTIESNTSPDEQYTATSNVMKIVFSSYEVSEPIGTGWEAEFTGVAPPTLTSSYSSPTTRPTATSSSSTPEATTSRELSTTSKSSDHHLTFIFVIMGFASLRNLM